MAEPREEIGKALAGKLTTEQISFLIDEVLATTKKGRAEFNCKKCGQRQLQYAEVPDARAVTSAIVELANQAWGRPDVANQISEEDRIVIVREVVK